VADPSSYASVTPAQLATLLADEPDLVLIDVREPYEYAAGHVEQAVPLPMSVLPARVQEVPQGRPVYLICHSGARSAQVAAWLAQQGHETINVEGGTSGWIAAGLHVVTGGPDVA
jgi:rhodanese-related sulfurtransferase